MAFSQVGGDPAPVVRWARQGRESLPGTATVQHQGLAITNLHPSDQVRACNNKITLIGTCYLYDLYHASKNCIFTVYVHPITYPLSRVCTFALVQTRRGV